MSDGRYSVKVLAKKEGADWKPQHTSFSKTSCEEEYDKAVKDTKNKNVRLESPTGEILKQKVITVEGTEQSTEQLSLL